MDIILRTDNSKTIDMLKKFAENIKATDDSNLVISNNIVKENWIEEVECCNEDFFEDKPFEETRKILEKEYDNFQSNGGWSNTDSYIDWIKYTPTFLKED